MKPEPGDLARMADALEALRRRVGPPERAGRGPGRPCRQAARAAATLSEELVMVISAAIAAFLGKRPHIRQIRLLRSDAWAQQGRTTIQASHARPA